MVFDIINEEYAVYPNFKGGEKHFSAKMHDDELNRFMQGMLISGASIGEHTHEGNSEIIYFLSGHGYVIYDGEKIPVSAGQCHYCPKGHTHSLVNDSDEELVFFAVVPNQ